jgi:tRNA(fMet)-specific endonuclease VapC
MYLLDTDTSIEVIRRNPLVEARMKRERHDVVFISAISHYELLYGALHSKAVEKHLNTTANFVAPISVLPFTSTTALRSSEVKQQLSTTGTLIGPLDLLIAGSALEHGLVLVTDNTREFARIDGLRVESWN